MLFKMNNYIAWSYNIACAIKNKLAKPEATRVNYITKKKEEGITIVSNRTICLNKT